ncbi:MAG: hypothetical protein JXQ73_17805, partial [Phycisphaerae bacterium]|nr:hypothetical protein [Phycisphaerae bacterium]
TEKDEDVTCDVKLHPAQYLTGQVLTPDGKPAADALLVMSRYPFPIILKNRRVEDSLDLYRQIHADKDGQFRFADPAEPTPLLVLHDKGWAMRSTKQPKTLVSVALQPWAGVQGTLTIARRPLPNQNIVVLATVGGTDLPLVTHQVTAKTDAQGRFALDHVLPGPAEIGQQMSLPRDAKLGLAAISPHKLLTRRRYIEPQPGKTTTVDLGGLGRTVAGAVKLPPADPGDPTVTWPPAANLISTCQSPPPMPEAVRNASAVKRQAWLDEWYKTPAGRAHRQAFRAFAAPVRPDGTFEVQAVPAGSYSLTLCACRKTSNKFLEGLPGMSSPKVVGWTRHDFEVPDTSPADEGSPMDLGQLTLKAPTPIRPGRPAPPIEFETPGGKPHRLADYRGKFVVLHLWWGSESIGTLNVDLSPFADDNRLAFLEIGVCDFASPEAQLYAKLSQTYSPFAPFGHFGLLDEDAGLQVASDLGLPPIKGLQSIATTLLIDPNGNVIASDLAPDQIAPAIAKALGTPQDQPKDAD